MFTCLCAEVTSPLLGKAHLPSSRAWQEQLHRPGLGRWASENLLNLEAQPSTQLQLPWVAPYPTSGRTGFLGRENRFYPLHPVSIFSRSLEI
jgi:hypothetical protein